MPDLYDLPPEVLILISLQLYPPEVVDFALASKRLYHASIKALARHKTLSDFHQTVQRKEYRQLKVRNWVDLIDTPFAFLWTLIERPRLSYYLTHLDCLSRLHENEWWPWNPAYDDERNEEEYDEGYREHGYTFLEERR